MLKIQSLLKHWIEYALRFAYMIQALKGWRWIRLSILVALDIQVMAITYYVAFALRLDDLSIKPFFTVYLKTVPLYIAIHIGVFLFGGMYRQVWRYANPKNIFLIGRLLLIATVLSYAVVYAQSYPYMILPRSIFLISFFLAIVGQIATKFSWRSIVYLKKSIGIPIRERCLVYGAGVSGESLVRMMATSDSFDFQPIGFIDDDPSKRGRIINGLKILGTGQDIATVATRYRAATVLITLHTAPGKVLRKIVDSCQQAKLATLIVPDLAKSLAYGLPKPRAVAVKDLLKRSPKSINRQETDQFFSGKSILITGAGGSIGSEIARQVLLSRPARLILLDTCEYNLYKIEMELVESGYTGILAPILGSVTDRELLISVFSEHRPQCILHAAAYKHVPLVEENILSSIKNNVLGTKTVIEIAISSGVHDFILISSDKAVRPSSIMGMTKRVGEILIQTYHEKYGEHCNFSAVRFGNVLGSSGSVIPRFLAQIEGGGPVTVTDKRMTRYFMLISEAVALVLQSTVKAKGGEIFVLDMGEPVNIFEMAKSLITLAGKTPFSDIDITFTGMRAGEKLHEELIIDGTERTEMHQDIFIAKPEGLDPNVAISRIDRLIAAVLSSDRDLAKSSLIDLASNNVYQDQQVHDDSIRMGAHAGQTSLGEAG